MLNELYQDEPLDTPFGPAEPPRDVVAARELMIRYHQARRRYEKTREVRDAVAASYDERLERGRREMDTLRGLLAGYVTQYGSLSLPDVGAVYERRVPRRLVVVDRAAFGKWALRQGFIRETWDEPAAKKAALELGEVPPGCEVEDESTDVTIRGAR
jgi:hypothetical protein